MKMHKITFGFLLFLLAGSSSAATVGPTDLSTVFQDDLSCYDAETQTITQLEDWVTSTGDTYPELVASGHPLLRAVVSERDISRSLIGMHAPDEGPLLGIPGFLWGFCCSFFGIILVLVSIDDDEVRKRETGRAALGCTAACLFWVALYFWFIYFAVY